MTTLDPYEMSYDERRAVVNAMLMITAQDIAEWTPVAADDESEEAQS